MRRTAWIAVGLVVLLSFSTRGPLPRALHGESHEGSHEESHTESHEESNKESHEGSSTGAKDDMSNHDMGNNKHHDMENYKLHHVYRQMHFGRSEMKATIGYMLIGGVTFMMSLFYLVNHPDEDMKRYTWIVIGTTISIFAAVLLFQSVEGLMHHYVIENVPHELHTVITLSHMVVWYIITQVVVSQIALAQKHKPRKQSYEKLKDSSPEVVNLKTRLAAATGKDPDTGEELHRNPSAEKAKSIGGLLAHITAFAAIFAFKDMQNDLHHHLDKVSLDVPGAMFLVPCVAVAVFLGLFHLAWQRRKAIMAADGQMEDQEKEWEHTVCEIEDDLFALCISYLITQCTARMVEGGPPQHEHTFGQIIVMMATAVAMMTGMVVIHYRKKEYQHHGADHHVLPDKSFTPHRLTDMAKLTCSFAFAWTMLTAVTWLLMFCQNKYGWTHIWMETVESLGLSISCVTIIYLLDKVADNATDDQVDEVIRESVLAFGFLIGFSWEHAFDLGVLAAVMRFKNYREVLQFLACCSISLIVLPAYVWYVVPIQFRHAAAHEAKKKREKTNGAVQNGAVQNGAVQNGSSA
jgi:hypothetical protein